MNGAAGGSGGTAAGNGGFGGGGGAGEIGGGGGGGGFSGGNGGSVVSNSPQGGRGGSSFDASTTPTVMLGFEPGNGSVTITPLAPPPSVPEPASLTLLGAGLAGLGLVLRGRKQGTS